MFNKIKELIGVNEEDIDLNELENTKDNKDLSYQEELKSNSQDLSYISESIKQEDTSSYRFTELDNEQNEVKETDNIKEQVIEIDNIETVIQPLSNTNKHSFDFEEEIEKAYDTPYYQEEEVKKEESNKKVYKDDSELVSKDNYVISPIIKPMSGIDSKDREIAEKKNEQKKSNIIKLREMNKIVDSNEDNYIEDFKMFEENTKRLEDELGSLSTQSRSSLKDTSKFTLVEDSTGEMRLVIDEDE